MKFLIITVGSALLLSGVGLFILAELEVRITSRMTWSEAEERGFFDAGWLPDFIPETSYDISETHDIDSNQSCSSFRLDQDALPALVAGLETIGFAEIDDTAVPERALPLAECHYSDPKAGADYLARTETPTGWIYYIAIFRNSGLVFHWSAYHSFGP